MQPDDNTGDLAPAGHHAVSEALSMGLKQRVARSLVVGLVAAVPFYVLYALAIGMMGVAQSNDQLSPASESAFGILAAGLPLLAVALPLAGLVTAGWLLRRQGVPNSGAITIVAAPMTVVMLVAIAVSAHPESVTLYLAGPALLSPGFGCAALITSPALRPGQRIAALAAVVALVPAATAANLLHQNISHNTALTSRHQRITRTRLPLLVPGLTGYRPEWIAIGPGDPSDMSYALTPAHLQPHATWLDLQRQRIEVQITPVPAGFAPPRRCNEFTWEQTDDPCQVLAAAEWLDRSWSHQDTYIVRRGNVAPGPADLSTVGWP